MTINFAIFHIPVVFRCGAAVSRGKPKNIARACVGKPTPLVKVTGSHASHASSCLACPKIVENPPFTPNTSESHAGVFFLLSGYSWHSHLRVSTSSGDNHLLLLAMGYRLTRTREPVRVKPYHLSSMTFPSTSSHAAGQSNHFGNMCGSSGSVDINRPRMPDIS